jgi:regulator of replication initiation timing
MKDMMNGLQRVLLLIGAGAILLNPLSGEPANWVYEGLITQADPALAPHLQSGWVLAGSFLFDPLELEEAIPMNEVRSGRLEGGISEGELTVDLYYQVHFEARQTTGYAGFDYHENDPDNDGRDVIGWFLPMSGKLKESDWQSTWLQVWLSDPEGNMLRAAPPAVPPAGFQWESAWFRLTFVDQAGEQAFAEGRMEVFSPESEVERLDPEAELSSIIADLGNRLVERDAVIEELRSDLATLQNRVTGLRSMVDLMVEERTHLQSETARLEEQLEQVDPQAQEALAGMTAEKALVEQKLSDMEAQNTTLEQRLGESEARRRELMDRIAELEVAIGGFGHDAPVPAEKAEASLTSAAGAEVGKITVFQSPTVIEREVPVEVSRPSRIAPPPSSSEPVSSSPRRFGPRKFR